MRKEINDQRGMVLQTSNPNPWETEAKALWFGGQCETLSKKNAVGVAQSVVCLAYMKPLVGSLALHKFAVTSTPKIPGLRKNQNSATPFESEANFGFQTSSQNKRGLKWRLTQQVRALAALKEFLAHIRQHPTTCNPSSRDPTLSLSSGGARTHMMQM